MTKTRKTIPKCQCTDENDVPCTHHASNNSLFCDKHTNCKASPLSGYEPKYEPEKFNNDPAVYKSLNCYSYSMGAMDPALTSKCRLNRAKNCRQFFHQPGGLKGKRHALNVEERRTCPVVEDLMKGDVPALQHSSFNQVCPKGTSKIALVVDKGEDYHFYRRDADDEGMDEYVNSKGIRHTQKGLWSHKDGSNKVKRFDALKRPIFNPMTASRDYTPQGSDLNYDNFCGFYCVPRTTEVHLGQGGRRAVKGGQHASRQKATRRISIAGLSWRDHHRKRATRRATRRA